MGYYIQKLHLVLYVCPGQTRTGPVMPVLSKIELQSMAEPATQLRQQQKVNLNQIRAAAASRVLLLAVLQCRVWGKPRFRGTQCHHEYGSFRSRKKTLSLYLLPVCPLALPRVFTVVVQRPSGPWRSLRRSALSRQVHHCRLWPHRWLSLMPHMASWLGPSDSCTGGLPSLHTLSDLTVTLQSAVISTRGSMGTLVTSTAPVTSVASMGSRSIASVGAVDLGSHQGLPYMYQLMQHMLQGLQGQPLAVPPLGSAPLPTVASTTVANMVTDRDNYLVQTRGGSIPSTGLSGYGNFANAGHPGAPKDSHLVNPPAVQRHPDWNGWLLALRPPGVCTSLKPGQSSSQSANGVAPPPLSHFHEKWILQVSQRGLMHTLILVNLHQSHWAKGLWRIWSLVTYQMFKVSGQLTLAVYRLIRLPSRRPFRLLGRIWPLL